MTAKRDPLAGGQSYAERLSKGRRKADYHQSTTLSVRLDDDLAEWVRGEAAAEGMSVNSWLRNLLENLRSQA